MRQLIRRLTALMAVLLLLPAAAPAESADLDARIDKIFKSRSTVGGMVLAVKDGKTVYQRCYGYADFPSRDSVTPQTYFKIASVSKLVTAVSVMKLVEDGRLDLDANLGDVLGGGSYFAANPLFPETPLTTRHLMTHTSSISQMGGYSKLRPLSLMLDVKNRREMDFEQFEPGTKYHYSNFGAGILGSVLEAVTGLRVSDACRSLIFDAMNIDAAYHPSQLSHPERIVSTYKADGQLEVARSRRLRETYDVTVRPDTDYKETYGKLWITGPDLAKIGVMLCDGGLWEGQRILKEETVQEMLSSQKGKGYVQIDSPYGLNVERVTNLLKDRMMYGHQGLADGVLCNLYFDPESRFVFVLVTNGCNSAKDHWIGILTRSLFNLLWETYGS